LVANATVEEIQWLFAYKLRQDEIVGTIGEQVLNNQSGVDNDETKGINAKRHNEEQEHYGMLDINI
jgi:hypothetical protein